MARQRPLGKTARNETLKLAANFHMVAQAFLERLVD